MQVELQDAKPALKLEEPAENGGSRRSRWRNALAAGLFYSGSLGILRAFSRRYELRAGARGTLSSLRRTRHPKFAILCYHRVGTGGVPLFSELPADVFEAQMRFLRRSYRVVSLDQLCDELEKPKTTEPSLAITFDDGYADLFTNAFPVLEKYRLPATIFLPVASIEAGLPPWYDRIFLALKVFAGDRFDVVLDRPRSFRLATHEARIWTASKIIEYLRTLPESRRKQLCAYIEKQVILPEQELAGRMLTWDQVRAMACAGIDFGSHTMTHPAVSQLTSEEMEHELADSKSIMEQRIGSRVRHFAFPFGKEADCGSEARRVLGSCGYRSAATTLQGSNSPGQDLYSLRRVSFGDEPRLSFFALKLGQLFLSATHAAPERLTPLLARPNAMPSEPAGERKVGVGSA